MRTYEKIFIEGAWVDPVAPASFELINPATETPCARIVMGGAEDVGRGVAAARRAFRSFSATSKAERLDLLRAISLAIAAREADLTEAITLEMGAPCSMRAHVIAGIESFNQAATSLADYDFEVRLGQNIVRREPIGVCGLITAWNWPVQILCTKLSAALAAGCTAVAKPSEFTSTSAIILTEALAAAGVPNGVFNLVLGDGPTVGNAISAHPGIDLVSFTGSTRAGVLVAQAAAPSVKRVAQELGGKSANVVLPDADLAAAARWNVSRGFSNVGQSCHAPTRVLVHRPQVDEVLRHMLDEVAKIKVGDPQDPATTMGPVVNKAQFDRIQNYIQTGIDEGARLVCGGTGRPNGLSLGYFVKPTIFADVTSDMTIARDEIFGPVLSVMAYDSEDEAVAIANDSSYGLGGYVFTRDREKAFEVGRQIRAGRIFLNGAPGSTAAPMGGYKRSGNGREMGVFGIEEYLEIKALIGYADLVA